MPLVYVYRILFIIALLYSFKMFFGTGIDSGIDIPHIDKLGHFLAFAGLSFLFDFAFALGNKILVLVSLLYGIAVELIQTQIEGRSGSLADLVADMTGTLCYIYFGNKIACRLFPVPTARATHHGN